MNHVNKSVLKILVIYHGIIAIDNTFANLTYKPNFNKISFFVLNVRGYLKPGVDSDHRY